MASKGNPTWKMGAKVIESPVNFLHYTSKLPVYWYSVIVYSCLVFADINECQKPDQYKCFGICSNTIGGYNCSCPSGTHSIDPKNSIWNPHTASEKAKLTKKKLFIGNFLTLHFSRVIRIACICHPNVADISKHQTHEIDSSNLSTVQSKMKWADRVLKHSLRIFHTWVKMCNLRSLTESYFLQSLPPCYS
jgi:hypothetical protein